MIKSYYHLCKLCKTNRVLVTAREKFPVCYECHKKQMSGKKVTDKKIKKLFNIPEEFYKENIFLRKIKLYYLKYKELTEKQIAAFKKTVEKIKKSSDQKP